MSHTKISIKRHIAKTISYRVLGTFVTIISAVIVGVPLNIAGLLGVGELLIKPIVYFLHERIWYKFSKFGVVKDNTDKIF